MYSALVQAVQGSHHRQYSEQSISLWIDFKINSQN